MGSRSGALLTRPRSLRRLVFDVVDGQPDALRVLPIQPNLLVGLTTEVEVAVDMRTREVHVAVAVNGDDRVVGNVANDADKAKNAWTAFNDREQKVAATAGRDPERYNEGVAWPLSRLRRPVAKLVDAAACQAAVPIGTSGFESQSAEGQPPDWLAVYADTGSSSSASVWRGRIVLKWRWSSVASLGSPRRSVTARTAQSTKPTFRSL